VKLYDQIHLHLAKGCRISIEELEQTEEQKAEQAELTAQAEAEKNA